AAGGADQEVGGAERVCRHVLSFSAATGPFYPRPRPGWSGMASRPCRMMPAVPNPGGAMITVVHESSRVSVPDWVVDLESFRRWADADDFPETGHVWFLKGEVWVDMSKEQIFTHGAVKTEFTVVLGSLVKTGRLGRLWGDGIFLSNVTADIAGKP